MNRIKTLCIFLLVCFVTFPAYSQSKYFKTGRSLDIQFSVLKELSMYYVDSVEIDKLIETGINAMLESLDPYTVLIPAEDQESLELMTTGSYGGIGALIRKTDNGILIGEVYENSPAAKSGLVAGDTILKIDNQDISGLIVDSCSARMKGRPGSQVAFLVKKLRGGDTVEVKVVRDKVHFPDVAYSGFVNDTTGYIRLNGFTLGGSKDFRRDLLELKKNSDMKRLMIDIRGNGGGLLDEAVNIVSLFVPKGTKVVSAIGRTKQSSMDYYTKDEPVDTSLAIVVLVNSGSASSSEIVAGALQDLDRATIVGTRTYGKGLVQSIRDVGYGDRIKLTTAKYYTPSGRCVQAIDYSHRNEDGSVGNIPDSLRRPFTTLKGRTVYDGGGITPDVIINPQTVPRAVMSLIFAEVLSDYSILYFRDHISIAKPKDFKLTDAEYEEFVSYASSRNFDGRSASEVELDRLVSILKEESMYDEFKDKVTALEENVKLTKEEMLRRNSNIIRPFLEEEIVSRYYYERGQIESVLRNDYQVKKALEVKLIN